VQPGAEHGKRCEAGDSVTRRCTRYLCIRYRSCPHGAQEEPKTCTDQPRPLKGAWGMTALLSVFMLINFARQGVVGLAAQPIMADLKSRPSSFGLIGSSSLLPVRVFPPSWSAFIPQPRADPHTLLIMASCGPSCSSPWWGTVSLEAADRLPHHPRRRRRPGRSDGHARDLQMAPRFPAAACTDGHHSPRARRSASSSRVPGAQLDHRQLFLALGLRCAGYRRAGLDGVVDDLRP